MSENSLNASGLTIWLLVIVLVAILGSGVGYLVWRQTKPSATAPSTTSPTTKPTTTQPTTAKIATDANPIVSETPQNNALVKSPLLLQGSAIAFENTFSARLKDANGKVLGETTITFNSPDAGQPGNYSASLTFETPTTDTGTLELYDHSMATGQENIRVTTPVKFK